MSMFDKLFGPSRARAAPDASRGDEAYAKAMMLSDDLIKRMQEHSRSTDPAHAIMADVWAQNHNVPFLTTVYEAVQEAKSSLEQDPQDT